MKTLGLSIMIVFCGLAGCDSDSETIDHTEARAIIYGSAYYSTGEPARISGFLYEARLSDPSYTDPVTYYPVLMGGVLADEQGRFRFKLGTSARGVRGDTVSQLTIQIRHLREGPSPADTTVVLPVLIPLRPEPEPVDSVRVDFVVPEALPGRR